MDLWLSWLIGWGIWIFCVIIFIFIVMIITDVNPFFALTKQHLVDKLFDYSFRLLKKEIFLTILSKASLIYKK